MLPFLGAVAAWNAIIAELPTPVTLFIVVVFAFAIVIGVLKIFLNQ